MNWHYLEKEYSDTADDIESVTIHDVCPALNSQLDWETPRVTRYMPVGKPASQVNASGLSTPTTGRLRKKVLQLPSHLAGPENGTGSARYHLHYYFEICQSGHRHCSPLYTEEVVTNGQATTGSPADTANWECPSQPSLLFPRAEKDKTPRKEKGKAVCRI